MANTTQNSKNIIGAMNVLAEQFANTEERVSRDGEVYNFNHMFFSQRDMLQGMCWKADQRLKQLHAAETKDYRTGFAQPNRYGLPYLKAAFAQTARQWKGGELDASALEAAQTALENCVTEIAALTEFRNCAAEVLETRTGVKYASPDHAAASVRKTTATKKQAADVDAFAAKMGITIEDDTDRDIENEVAASQAKKS